MVSAVELAHAYDAYISALWRGDANVAPFEAWLSRCWHPGPTSLPTAPPTAISPCGGRGWGIHWHDTATAVLGYVPGAGGCYLVPLDAVPPTPDPLYTDVVRSDPSAAT